jgi:hypothetical protein
MGEIVTFNSTGFILKSNDAYLPRFALTNVAEPDFRALLESRTVYDALTLFRAGAPRTADSSYYETRLRVLWTNTPSLSARIRTRAAILDIMRAYNDSLAAYAGSVGFENNATAISKTAISSEYTDATASSNAAVKVGSAQNHHDEHEAWHDYRTANNNLNNDTIRATGASNLAVSMGQSAAAYRNNAEFYAARLASYGIGITTRPMLKPIPPLLMRFEVDLARVSQ